VDKLDFLITLYRTFIRSRKWTLKMFTHAVDMACANSWLEYKAKAALLNIPNSNSWEETFHFVQLMNDWLDLLN
jgi:hypothetical protein